MGAHHVCFMYVSPCKRGITGQKFGYGREADCKTRRAVKMERAIGLLEDGVKNCKNVRDPQAETGEV